MKPNNLNQHHLPRYTQIASFVATVCLLCVAHSSVAWQAEATTAEPITGTAPTGSAEFSVQIAPSSTTYLTNSTLFVQPSQKPSNLQFSGSLLNSVVIDADNDVNPTLAVADLVTTPIEYRWFDGSTLIANAASLTDFTAYASKPLILEVLLPVVVSTKTGFPRNNLGADGLPAQTLTQRFDVQVAQIPNLVANETTFALNSGFPQTGFEGARFRINAPLTADNYSWQSTASSLASVSQTGVVTLNAMPNDANTPIKITATPTSAAAIAAGFSAFEYEFTLKQWFIHNGTAKGNRAANIAFCSTQSEPNYAIPSLGYNLVSGNARSANGKLWNEWGDLSIYNVTKPWAAQSATNTYWAAEVGGAGKYNLFQSTSLTNGTVAPVGTAVADTTTHFQACVRNLDGTPAYPIPSLTDVALTGYVGEVGNWALNYRFNANGGGADTSTFYQNFGSKGTGATQILASNTLVNGVFDALTGLTGKTIPVTLVESSGVAEFSVRPIDSNNIVGEPLLIDTTMLGGNGNLLSYRLHSISTQVINANFPIKPLGDADNFPKTGFASAQFRINTGDANGIGNNRFSWQIVKADDDSATDLAKVNQAGLVTLLKDPAQATALAVIVTPSGGGTPLRYEFKVEKWFYPDLPMPEKSITSFDNVNTKLNPSITPFVIADGFPKTGFTNAQFVLNILGWADVNVNSDYTWGSSHEDLASVDATGTVTLLKRPDSATPITITATPPAGSINGPLTYTFTVETWFEPNFPLPSLRPPVTQFSSIVAPPSSNTMSAMFDINSGFPTTGFAKAQFKLNILDPWDDAVDLAANYTWSSDQPLLASVNPTTGIVLLLKDPSVTTEVTITAVPKDGVSATLRYSFTLKEWWNPMF